MHSRETMESHLNTYTIDECDETNADTDSQALTSIPNDASNGLPKTDKSLQSKDIPPPKLNYLMDNKARRKESVYHVHRFQSISAATASELARVDSNRYPSILDDIEKRIRQCCFPIFSLACSTVFGRVLIILCMMLAIGLPVAMVTIGALKLNQCPADQMIIAYLLLGGVGALFAACCLTTICRDTVDERNVNANHCSWFLNVFTVIWFVCGTIWVYKLNPNFDDVAKKNFCDKLVYRFTFTLVTSTIAVIVLCFIAFLVSIFYKLCKKK